MDVFELIQAQQKGKENTTVFVVGQQLKDICRADPHCAKLVAADLANGAMSEEERRNLTQGNGGRSNPALMEWLMGFPIGWTDLDA